jgi:hypothetical protein
MSAKGVSYLKLATERTSNRLPLAAVWLRDSRDALRDDLLETLMRNLDRYAAQA